MLALPSIGAIVDLEAEISKLRTDLANATAERDQFVASDKARREELNAQYTNALTTFQRLRTELWA